MMALLQKYKTFIIALGIVVIAGVIYTQFFGNENSQSLIVSQRVSDQSVAAGRGVLELLITLRAIDIDDALFASPVFQSLNDFSKELVPEPVGRPNPFSPLGIDNPSSRSVDLSASDSDREDILQGFGN